jgi:hypothetical protein
MKISPTPIISMTVTTRVRHKRSPLCPFAIWFTLKRTMGMWYGPTRRAALRRQRLELLTQE